MGADEWTADIWRCSGSSYKAFLPVASISNYTFLAMFPYLKAVTQSQGLLLLWAMGSSTFYFQEESFFKESACNAEDLGSIPGLGRSPGEGNGNPLQFYCLENSMHREAWQATVHEVSKSWT